MRRKTAVVAVVFGVFACVAIFGQTPAPSGPKTDLGNWIFATVSGVRTWAEYDTIQPPDGMGEGWASGALAIKDYSEGSQMIAGSSRITVGNDSYGMTIQNFVTFSNSPAPKAKGVYRELTVWISNTGRKPASLDMMAKGAKTLDVQLVLPDKSRLAPCGFRFPSMGAFAACFATAWEGKLGFTLAPGRKTWLLLLFDVPRGLDNGQLQIKKAAPLKIKLAE